MGGGKRQVLPPRTLDFDNCLNEQAIATKLTGGFFTEFLKFLLLTKDYSFFEVPLTILAHFGSIIDFGYFRSGQFWYFLEVLEKSRNPRWRMQDGHLLKNTEILTSYDDMRSCFGPQRKQFWTYCLSSKLRCYSFNILGVNEGKESPPDPEDQEKPHYRLELLGHVPVCLPPQCWGTRYGD